ncbi:MAG: TlpA disulfide reductase family protein [Myxococcaceae bacterium]
MIRKFVVVALSLAPSFALADDLAEVDKPAPTFRLPVYNPKEFGEATVAIDTYVGAEATDKKTKVLVVSFMASFCQPCKKEMPYLQTLHEKYRDAGLRIMSVAIDSEADGQKKVEELIAENKVTYPVAKDRFNIVARRWLGNQSPLPSLFFVKPDGTVSSVHRGYSSDGAEVLAEELGKVLGVKVDRPVAVVEKPAEPAPVIDAGVPEPEKKPDAKTGKKPKKKK